PHPDCFAARSSRPSPATGGRVDPRRWRTQQQIRDRLPAGAGSACSLSTTSKSSMTASSWCSRASRSSPVRARSRRCWAPTPLAERRYRQAGYLSGGEQQMLVIGRALMSGPKVILLDEPSLGLAPRFIEDISQAILKLKAERSLTVVLVEQNAALALEVADHG